MAIVSKEITFTGTVGDLTFYRWEDRIFVRKKSSLTRERVLKDKAFAGLRKHAGDMGRASKLASEIYKLLPGDIKGRLSSVLSPVMRRPCFSKGNPKNR